MGPAAAIARSAQKESKKNAGASLVDLGEDVVCPEFHFKINTIGNDTVQMSHAGLKAVNDGFGAMMIGNQAANFCVGANLMMVLMTTQEGESEDLQSAVHAFQNVNMALKRAPNWSSRTTRW